MRQLFVAFIFLGLLSGCATLQLPKDATIEQKTAAKQVDCDAANALVEKSNEMLARLKAGGDLDQDAISYWSDARFGAQMALSITCAGAGTATK